MGRLLTGLAGALGLAWLWRRLHREQAQTQPPELDPAAELREKLAQAREAADDRDEFDASEGQPVDEIERTPPASEPETDPDPDPDSEGSVSHDERRRAIHEKAQQALGEMGQLGRDE